MNPAAEWSHPVKKTVAILLALSLLLSLAACAVSQVPQEAVVSGGGVIEFSSSGSSREPVDPESPPAVQEEDGPSFAPISSSDAPSVSSGPSSAPASSGGQTSAVSPASVSSSVLSSSSSVSSSQPSSSSSSRSRSVSDDEDDEDEEDEPRPSRSTVSADDEVRAIWLSYLDLGPLLKNRSESQFTASIRGVFDDVADLGLNTVYAQVRPFGDALYDSDYFPASYLFTGTERGIGQQPYDALEIMVEEAHRRGLKIEAWLNPYRVYTSSRTLSDDNPAVEMLETGDALRYDGGVYYNPGSPAARSLIVNGVREIVDGYDVDGIHFDDYFYPPNAPASFDAATYQASGSGKSLGDWRREQVDILVKEVYAAVGGGKVFGISPAGNNDNNYNALYCNVEKWLTNSGYVDYICPQVYFGFTNSVKPYKKTVDEFNDMITRSGVKLYVGLAAYKIGDANQGGAEWVNNTDIMARQVEYARKVSRYGGFALYRYDSLFNPGSGVASAVKKEIANLKDIL